MFMKGSALKVALVLLSFSSASSFQVEGTIKSCTVRSYRMMIEDKSCQNSRMIASFKCGGGCRSVTDVEGENPENIFKECSCCVPSKLSHQVVELDCFPPLRKLFNITVIEKCTCRPCDV